MSEKNTRTFLNMKTSTLVAIILFLLATLLLYLGIIDRRLVGYYVYGYDKILFLPFNPLSIVCLIIVIVLFYSVIENKELILMNKYNLRIVFLALLVGLLVFLNLDGDHSAIVDSYVLLAGAVDIIDGGGISTRLCYPSPSLLLVPFIVMKSEFFAQIGIALYFVVFLLMSSRLIELLTQEKGLKYLFVVSLVANPMMIVLARTLSYEAILLMLLALQLNLFYYLTNFHTKGKDYYKALMAFLVVNELIVFVNIPHILIVVAPAIVILFLHNLYRLLEGELRDSLITLLLLLAFSFIYIHSAWLLLKPRYSPDKILKSFSPTQDILTRHIVLETYLMLLPLNGFPVRSGFAFYLLKTENMLLLAIFIAPMSVYMFARGIFEGIRNSKTRSLSLHMLFVFVLDFLFFMFYVGWQARYLILMIYIESVFIFMAFPRITKQQIKDTDVVDIGVSKKFLAVVKSVSKLLLIASLFYVLLMSTANSSILVYHWDASSVFDVNSVNATENELISTFEIIKNHAGKKVVFTYLYALIYFYRYKLGIDNLTIESICQYFRYGFNEKTFSNFLLVLEYYMGSGYIVFYLAGWPELDGKYKWVYNKIKTMYPYVVLARGNKHYRKSWYYYAPSYELICIFPSNHSVITGGGIE